MSIGAMANAALARRPDFGSAEHPPNGVGEIVAAVRGENAPQSATTNVLDLLATYIPSEIITLYIAMLGVTLGVAKDTKPTGPYPPVAVDLDAFAPGRHAVGGLAGIRRQAARGQQAAADGPGDVAQMGNVRGHDRLPDLGVRRPEQPLFRICGGTRPRLPGSWLW